MLIDALIRTGKDSYRFPTAEEYTEIDNIILACHHSRVHPSTTTSIRVYIPQTIRNHIELLAIDRSGNFYDMPTESANELLEVFTKSNIPGLVFSLAIDAYIHTHVTEIYNLDIIYAKNGTLVISKQNTVNETKKKIKL